MVRPARHRPPPGGRAAAAAAAAAAKAAQALSRALVRAGGQLARLGRSAFSKGDFLLFTALPLVLAWTAWCTPRPAPVGPRTAACGVGGGAAQPGAGCEAGSRRLRRAARGDTHIANGYGAGALRRAAALERRHHELRVLPAAVARRTPLQPQPEARLHGALRHPPPGSIR